VDKPPEELLRELEWLRSQVAALIARVYALEQAAAEQPKAPNFATPSIAPLSGEQVPPSVELPKVPSAGVGETTAPAVPAPPPPPPRVPAPPPFAGLAKPGLPPLPTFVHVPRAASGDLERKIGQYWLNRVGIVAILTGVSYFLKYAFENNWIGPSGRVAIGLLAGAGLILWSERFRAKGHPAFSYSLKAVGLGTLYLSLWAAFQVYHLVPVEVAFGAMAVVTGATIVLAWTQNAMVLAAFALAGGFATPLLLSTGENHEASLFTYVALLDIAVLALIVLRPWLQLAWGSFFGTLLLAGLWAERYYRSDNREETTVFFALFAVIFALGPLLSEDSTLEESRRMASACVLALLNATAFFWELYAMYSDERTTLTWFALLLASSYLALADAFRRVRKHDDDLTIRLVHITLAVTFLTIAVPLKLEGHSISIAWIVESAALLWVAARTETKALGKLGLAALLLGIIKLLSISGERAPHLVFNARFFTYLLAIAVLGAVLRYGEPEVSGNLQPLVKAGKIALSLLALTALTLEAADYFDWQMAGPLGRTGNRGYEHYAQWRVMRDFTYSAIWLLYGTGLMAAGFWKRSGFLRWQALALMAFTIVKVFVYDVAALDKGYRIVSFVALGGVLLAISFIYQRDWLKLSRHEEAAQ
jgi:uncharacterized membrane protein